MHFSTDVACNVSTFEFIFCTDRNVYATLKLTDRNVYATLKLTDRNVYATNNITISIILYKIEPLKNNFINIRIRIRRDVACYVSTFFLKITFIKYIP